MTWTGFTPVGKCRAFRAALFFCACTSGVTWGQQPLPSSSAQALLRRVDDHYNRLTSMRTHFTEQYTGMGMSRTETGTLLLSKPGRMRWVYDKPAGKLFLFDGKYAWFYTPGDPQVQRAPARQMTDLRTPLRFLLGHTQLERELDGLTVTQDGSELKISGTPKGSSKLNRIVLEVTPLGEITGMTLLESNEFQTTFSFKGTEENIRISGGDFQFKVPAGVTIVDGTPPL